MSWSKGTLIRRDVVVQSVSMFRFLDEQVADGRQELVDRLRSTIRRPVLQELAQQGRRRRQYELRPLHGRTVVHAGAELANGTGEALESDANEL